MATMATIPDAASIDWANVAAWAAGITTVAVSVGVAAWAAIRKAVQIAASAPPQIRTDTKIITTDSVAMHELAATLEASNAILTENNVLRREEHNDREANRRTLQANTDAMERAVTALNEARADIRELTREIVRSSNSKGAGR